MEKELYKSKHVSPKKWLEQMSLLSLLPSTLGKNFKDTIHNNKENGRKDRASEIFQQVHGRQEQREKWHREDRVCTWKESPEGRVPSHIPCSRSGDASSWRD